ncbi:MAG: EamA family transporter [Gammaproteobacteria bacterium]|nr:MAG: EamA family transporter [Gammaproteobacteria bacterium]
MPVAFQSPLLQLIASSIILGLGAVFVVFIDLGTTVIAFYRLFFGGLLFAALLWLKKEPLAINSKALLFALLAGAFLGLDLSLWNKSIVLIGPGMATILNSLQIFFMAGFGIIFYGEKPTGKLWTSLLLTFTGVVLLSHHEIQTATNGMSGVIVGILSALAFAASMLSLRETAKYQDHSLINTMFYTSVGGAFTTGIYAFGAHEPFITNDINSWLMIAIYASIVHVLAWFLMAKSIPKITVAVVGLVMCLEPLTVFCVDLGLLHKSITFWQAIGAMLTLTAVYLGSQSTKRKTP